MNYFSQIMHLLPLTFAFLGLFSYPSQLQALEACEQWRDQGGTVRYTSHRREYLDFLPFCDDGSIKSSCFENLPTNVEYEHSVNVRKCKLESNTNQYIGLSSPTLQKLSGQHVGNEPERPDDWTVRKHFRF